MAGTIDAALTATLERYGQDHLLGFWDRLDNDARSRLAAQLGSLDFALVDRLAGQFLRTADASAEADVAAPTLAPADVVHVGRDAAADADARRAGEALIAAGKVAALTVAGGQGSRLGFDGPKGAFPIGALSGMTLFEVFGRTIRALRERHGAPLPWLLMTSEANHADTVRFFESHDFFGLAKDTVHFFSQGMVPSVDMDGKALLAAPDRVATNPDGHGGTLLALKDSGSLDRLRADGVEVVYYFQVDNPLAAIADPVFVGYHHQAGADMSSKAVEKSGPDEKVGVIVKRDGVLGVIEYSDLDDATAAERNDDGSLTYGAGNIAIHAFSTEFLERVTGGELRLPYHKAHKKVPHIDTDGNAVTPASPNAIKFETFVFDALEFAKASATLMVPREDEFSPVKNASGVDSVETAQQHLSERAARWIEAAGGSVPRDESGRVTVKLEIDPLFALDADAFKAKCGAVEVTGDRHFA